MYIIFLWNTGNMLEHLGKYALATNIVGMVHLSFCPRTKEIALGVETKTHIPGLRTEEHVLGVRTCVG